MHENRGGVERVYGQDPLGSTAALYDATGTKTDEYSYWPYGEIRNHTGSSTTPFTFVGTLGYYTDQLAQLYVRARFLMTSLARWLTVDPLWPDEPAYAYVSQRPTSIIDMTGFIGESVIIAGLGVGIVEILPLIAGLLGIALGVLLAILLILGIVALLSFICGKIYKRLKDICGDPDGRPSDVSGGGCNWCDSCAALFYKGTAYGRCTSIRILYSLICYGGIDPAHLGPIRGNAVQAGRCEAMFVMKGCGSFPGPIVPSLPGIRN